MPCAGPWLLRFTRISLISLVIAYPLTSQGQTQRGDILLGFSGSIDRANGVTSSQVNLGSDYLFTDHLFLGGSWGSQKTSGWDATNVVGARLGIMMNSDPGKQKVVPYLNAFGGVGFSGEETQSVVGGAIGILAYVNRRAGFSVGVSYGRNFPEDYRSFGEYNLSWGFFLNFPTAD